MSTLAPVLLVDDSPYDVEFALEALQACGLDNTVVIARDGAEALDRLLGPERLVPALILLDLKMPRLDGLQVLQRLRATDAHRLTPVLMVTGSREERDLVESYALGVTGYLEKPVAFASLFDLLDRLDLNWVARRESPAV